MKTILVTGSAGFIGFHVSKRLLHEGYHVIGIDNLNDYYSISLKKSRLDQLNRFAEFQFIKADIADTKWPKKIPGSPRIGAIIHLAAQGGVRYSLNNPGAYIQSNLVGFANILEFHRHYLGSEKHLIYASSSSVYGANRKQPYSEHQGVNHPISLYSATKRSNELMAHSYAHLYDIPVTGLRFFTVYGPWGRPDMAYFKFARKIKNGEPIQIYNNGDMYRDFTYIDDIVESIVRLLPLKPTRNERWKKQHLTSDKPDPATSYAPFRIFNIGNNAPVKLMDFIEILEENLGLEAKKEYKPMQKGDVYKTWAECNNLFELTSFKPKTPLQTGIGAFAEWFNWYYQKISTL